MGWAITGACPGPIYAQIGSGTLLAMVTFIGALAGMYVYAFCSQNCRITIGIGRERKRVMSVPQLKLRLEIQ
ncbi:MAG: hypothetical protein M5U34_20495 [Chloroflexi bacterium]|nr:hypothetical protein [Chloroflexota bacterium]